MSDLLDGIRGLGTGNPPPTPVNETQYELQSQSAQEYPDPADWDYKTATVNMNGEELPPGALGWRPDGTPDFGTGFKGWATSAYYNIQKAWSEGWAEGEAIAKEQGYEGDLMPRWTSSFETTKAIGGELLFGGLNAIGQLAIWTKQAGAAVGFGLRDIYLYGKDPGEVNWRENWEVGRLAYNAVFQGFTEKGDALREEFVQRMSNGERPDLIAEDMQIRGDANPWVELVGELVFDPLNADLFMNWFGKGRKAAATMKTVRAATLVPEATEVAKLVKEGAEALSKTGDELSAAAEFGRAFEAQRSVLKGVDEMVQVLQKPGALKPVASAIGDLPKRVRQYAGLISDSRHAALSNRSATVIEHIVKSLKDPGDVLDVIENIVKLQSDDIKVAQDAFTFLSKQKAFGAIVSEAGNEFAILAKRMTQKYADTWFDAIEIAARDGDTAAVGAELLKKLGSTMDELFPKAEDMTKAYDAMKAGKELTDAEMKLAALGGRMNPMERAVSRMHSAAQQGLVGKLNKFFVTVYMDWSPAYAFRNGLQNSIQIFLDYGPGAFLQSGDEALAIAERMNNGSLRAAKGFEAGKAVTGGTKQAAQEIKGTGVFDALREMFKTKSARAGSEVLETGGARRIVGHTYQKTFKQALDPLVDSLRKDKAFAKLPEPIWDAIKAGIINNYGDVTAALQDARKANQYGIVDLFRNMNRVPKGLQKFLEQTTKADEFMQTVLRANTKDEALAALDKIFNDLDTASKAVYVDSRYVTDAHDEFTMLMQKEGLSTSLKGRWLSVQQQVNRQTIAIAEEVVSKADSLLDQAGIRVDKAAIKKQLGMNFADWGTKTSTEIQAKRQAWWNVYDVLKKTRDPEKQLAIIDKFWPDISRFLDGRAVKPTTREEFGKTWEVLEQLQNEAWFSARAETLEKVPEYLDALKTAGGVLPDALKATIDDAIAEAQKWANVSIGEFGVFVDDGIQLTGPRKSQIFELASKYGISSAIEAGVPIDKKIIRIINKYGKAGIESLDDPISMELVERAFAQHTGETVKGANVLPLVPPYQGGTVPSFARGLFEGNLQEVKRLFGEYVEKNFGRTQVISSSTDTERLLDELAPIVEQRVNDIRTVSAQVAEENRNFTLLNYGQRTYLDVASAYLFPYGFWYKGTYNNWIQRVAQNPAIIAGYAKYKKALMTAHAGLPDWWKQNIQIDNFLGIELDNPLYFNLEATLWPLNGLTGEDFNDPKKRVDWWTYTLDNLGKFGPSTWTPLNMITGLILRNQGEEEASDRWLGRMIPQTALLKTWTNVELDPFVGLMQGGLDPYERRRVGRALSEMVANGLVSQEEAIDAARSQDGEIWENAIRNSNASRKMAQSMSTLFGVGFKARTQSDMEIDKFDAEYRRLMSMKHGGYVDSDTFREQMALMAEKYPFMDTVLISRRGGIDRDAALGYNVLSRIPPGEASQLFDALGVSSDMVDRFYADKGDMSKWTEGDRLRMTSAFVDLAATFKLPDTPTRTDWNLARSLYSDMRSAIQKELGDDIWEKVDAYYDADPDTRQSLLEMMPEIQDAFDMKSAFVANNETLNKYYGGIDTIQMYYSSQARNRLAGEFGPQIFDLSTQYMEMLDSKQKKEFMKNHPELKQYYSRKAELDDWVLRMAAQASSKMQTRADVAVRDPQSDTQNMLAGLVNKPTMTAEQWAQQLGPEVMTFIQDYANGEKLPYTVQNRLDYLAGRMGYYSADDMLAAILESLYRR